MPKTTPSREGLATHWLIVWGDRLCCPLGSSRFREMTTAALAFWKR
jgi:hypothetical protein